MSVYRHTIDIINFIKYTINIICVCFYIFKGGIKWGELKQMVQFETKNRKNMVFIVLVLIFVITAVFVGMKLGFNNAKVALNDKNSQ